MTVWPLPLSLATTRGISFDFSSWGYLDVSVRPVSPPQAMFSPVDNRAFTPVGFPHSDIRGSRDICSSPRLFAAYHVLRRLSVPRHSPCALCNLTFFFGSLSSIILTRSMKLFLKTRFCVTCPLGQVSTSCKTFFLCFSRLSFYLQSFLSYAVVKVHGLIKARALWGAGGDNESRTRDLLLARQALSQLSYAPVGSRIGP